MIEESEKKGEWEEKKVRRECRDRKVRRQKRRELVMETLKEGIKKYVSRKLGV